MTSSKSVHAELTVNAFWSSVHILLEKPHVVNKRLWGSKKWTQLNCRPINSSWELPTTCGNLMDSITGENIEEHITHMLTEFKLCLDTTSDGEVKVILTELLPKVYAAKHAYQLACLQRNKSIVTFYNVTPVSWQQNQCPDFRYSIHLHQNEVILTAYNGQETKSYQWLADTLLPQFIKWGINENNKTSTIICTESLALVTKQKYYEKYNNLKEKYGKDIISIWPECTDPSKFIYEDIAIASYLLVLWEKDTSKEKKTFVDLGCGNGLLVYLLAKEGHNGLGLDVRKRKIWDLYPPEVILQEETITPTSIPNFPEVDWIIGNHSDELTPWIPIIAAKASFDCNFFVLPCCPYNIDGSKYQRKNSYDSQYNDYLGYIKQLCEECGFSVGIDRLKIPSTKRICLIGNSRIYAKEEHEKYCQIIDNMLCSISTDKEFKPREKVERVRNCTQIDKSVISEIVNIITTYLLDGCKEINTLWSKGKTANFNQLVQMIPQNLLNTLKSECGGLQTLLKNNHNIFKVQSGTVELRYPKTIEEVNRESKIRKPNRAAIKVKLKPCWFYSNHPQGCPLKDEDCSFLHNITS